MSTFNPIPFAQAAFKEVQKTLQASIIKANVEILERVAGDYDLDFDDMINRYGLAVATIDLIVPVAPPAPKKKTIGEPKAPCSAINAKKRPCKRVAMPGCAMCKLHARQATEDRCRLGQATETEHQDAARTEHQDAARTEHQDAARTEHQDAARTEHQDAARTEAGTPDKRTAEDNSGREDIARTEPLDFDEMYPEELQLELSDDEDDEEFI